MSRLSLLLVALALGCSETTDAPAASDGQTVSDAAPVFDATRPTGDAAVEPAPDTGERDAARDAGTGDAGNGDAGNGDAGNGDAGNGDAGNGDAGPDAQVAPQADAEVDPCAPQSGLDCDDGNPCTADACEPGIGCVRAPVDGVCDDMNACTVDDRCEAGTCVGRLLDDDGDGVPGPGCGGTDCDDGDPTRFPGAPETCNLRDDDCDNAVDEVPPARDCTLANAVDADGRCDPAAADPTGRYRNAQVVDLGQPFLDVRLNLRVATDAAGCVVEVSTSADGERWLDVWSGVAGSGVVLAGAPARFIRAGSDACGVTGLEVDPICVCEPPLAIDCSQLNALDDGRCCCFQESHVLDLAEVVVDRGVTCELATGFSRGCEANVSIEVSEDGEAWVEVDRYGTRSEPREEGGWVPTARAFRPETPFRFLRARADACFIDTLVCEVDPPCTPKYDCDAPDAPACDDGDPCTIDRCDDRLGCVADPLCPEDDDRCVTTVCRPGPEPECIRSPVECDDGVLCTVDRCDSETGRCEHVPQVAGHPACDDGDPCTADVCLTACAGEACVERCAQTEVACPQAPDACSVSLCGADGCALAPVACADADPCTIDRCDPVAGCTHEPDPCDDGDPTTFDRCDPRSGCVHEPGGAPEPCVDVVCDDGDPCNGVERCDPQDGACLAGVPLRCDDGNACNGEERCDPVRGGCVAGEPIVCDDGNACDGSERCDPSSGACLAEALECPLAPDECRQAGGIGGPQGDRSTPGSTTGLRLTLDGGRADRAAIWAGVEAHRSTSPADYAALLLNLNRDGDRVAWVPGAECFEAGFRFNDGDSAVDYWWPQGISGTGDARADHAINGEQITLVSWYHKPGEDASTNVNKGARLSFIRTTRLDDVAYRNLLLVEPVRDGAGQPGYQPIPTHAGGIVWFGDRLYVSDTGRGLLVFDLSRVLRVRTGDRSAIGYRASDDAYHAFNYRYAVPLMEKWVRCDASCCARFSFVGLDRTVDPPTLAAGSYTDANRNGPLHRWALDPATGHLATAGGVAEPVDLFYPNVLRMQGALSIDGTWYVSSSQPRVLALPPTPGSLYVTRPGRVPDARGFPLLPEDLYYARRDRRLWSVTELPNHRYVFAVRAAGCD